MYIAVVFYEFIGFKHFYRQFDEVLEVDEHLVKACRGEGGQGWLVGNMSCSVAERSLRTRSNYRIRLKIRCKVIALSNSAALVFIELFSVFSMGIG